MGGNDDVPEKVKAMADVPPPPPPPLTPTPGSPLRTPSAAPPPPARVGGGGDPGGGATISPDNAAAEQPPPPDRSVLSPPLLLEIEEGTPAAEALKANADIRVSKLRKAGRSTRLQAGVRALKSAARTAYGQPGHTGDRRGAPAFVAPRSSALSGGSSKAGLPPPTIPEVDDEGDSTAGGKGGRRAKASADGDAEGEGGDENRGAEAKSVGEDSASTGDAKSIDFDDNSGTGGNHVDLPPTSFLSPHPGPKYSNHRRVTTHVALPSAIAAACRAGEEMDRKRAFNASHGDLRSQPFNLFKSENRLPPGDDDDDDENASPTRLSPRQRNNRLTSSLVLPSHAHSVPLQRRSSRDLRMPSEISVAETEKHANLKHSSLDQKIDDEELSDDGEELIATEEGGAPTHVQFKKQVQVDPIVVEIPGSRHEETKEYELTDEEMAARKALMKEAKKKKLSLRKKKSASVDDDDVFHFAGPRSVRKWVNNKRTKEEHKNQRSYVKGKVIDGKHEQYTMAIAVAFGMRTCIGRTNLAMANNSHNERRWLDNDDMMAVEKYEFPPRGSDITPPHQLNHTFKFKDYSPLAFAYLRKTFGVNELDFLMSVCGKANYIEFISNAKSGQFFFYSPDGKYMIKTMTNSESKFLRRIMPHYFRHCANNPNTLIAKFLGMYRVKLYHIRRNVKFVVMKSVFDTDKDLHQMFDVKGSSLGREARPTDAVKKDNDIRRVLPDGAFVLEPGVRKRIRAQVEKDCQWLGSMKIMDYSMLIGVHHVALRKTKMAKSVSQPMRVFSKDDMGDDRSNSSYDASMHTLDRFLDVDDDGSYLDGANPKGSGSMRRVAYDASSVSTPDNAVKTVRVLKGPDAVDEDSSRGSLRGSEALVEKAIEDMYWPFHRFYDIQGRRRMKPMSDALIAPKKDDETTETEGKEEGRTFFGGLFAPHLQSSHGAGKDLPIFEKPLSIRKDEGFTLDTSGMDLPLKLNVPGAPNQVEYCDGKIIYMGIIDILQQFNIRKRVEARYRKAGTIGWEAASCVHPKLYADRFLRFFDEYTQSPPRPTRGCAGENTSLVSDTASNHSEISSKVKMKTA